MSSETPTIDVVRPPEQPAAPGASTGGRHLFSRLHWCWRGHPHDPAWARPALLVLLGATAALYFWNLTASGWANSFYSAAVQAGSTNWEAFFYGSSDAANSITVDKTPAALWVMALSVRLLGLSSFSILMPQVLMGVASVGVLHTSVKRYFGSPAGLVAGAVLALTPVAALMFRFNNPDALLTLLMVLGALATLRAVEKGSWRWLVVVGVLLGTGFLTKMLQVVVVVPAFALTYLVAATAPLRRRILQLLVAGAAMVLTAGWWVAVVELVPASARPYIGGSQHNSILELTLGYNGIGRLDGNETGSVGGGAGPGGGQWGQTGLLRLFNSEIGGQISWLIPSALIVLAAGLWLRGRAPRTDVRRAALILWGGWLIVTGLVFSLMGGIFHAYYTIALAPAVGALVGIGGALAWEHRRRLVGLAALVGAVLAATLWSWQLLARTPDWYPWLRAVVLVLGLGAVVLLVAGRLATRVLPVAVATALAAVLVGPTAYTLQTVGTAHTGSIPEAGPAVQGGFGGPGGFTGGMPGRGGGSRGALPQSPNFAGGQPPNAQGSPGGSSPGAGQAPGAGGTMPGLPSRSTGSQGGMGGLLDASTPSTAVVAALSEDASRYTWVAATIGSQNAAGLQLATQLPVMAIGGFNGSDPSPTLAQFKSWVAEGQIHYFALGGMGGGPGGGQGTGSSIRTWVEAHFTKVTIGGSTFYDLTKPVSSSSESSSTTGSEV